MEIGRIAGATRHFGAPKDWDKERDGHCGTLAIRDTPTDIGNAMISAWFPSAAEVAAMAAGAPLYLHIYGTCHPVVAMSVGAPPDDTLSP